MTNATEYATIGTMFSPAVEQRILVEQEAAKPKKVAPAKKKEA